jgi:long-chain acyl-CoA synthetase
MSLLTDVHDRIEQARAVSGCAPELHWTSFAEFFRSRLYDPRLVTRNFLTYCDDERGLRRTYSYAEFGTIVERMAEMFHARFGLTRGDRIATLLFNHDLTALIYFAAWTLGVAVVPINVEETSEKKRYILAHSEASVALCWQDVYEELKALQPMLPALREVVALGDGGILDGKETRGKSRKNSHAVGARFAPGPSRLDDPALIIYTSGTTGPPKGVILTVANLLIDADAIADRHGFGLTDRLMCVLPVHHVNGIVVTLMTPFYCKGSVVLNRKFKTGSFWRRLHEEQATGVSVVPTLLEFLLDANEDIAAYRLDRFGGAICGAGPLLKDTALRFEDRFGFPIRHGYGLSETTCYSSFLPNDLTGEEHRHWLTDFDFPSIGTALRHNEMAILDESGKPVPERKRGEICIRGRTVCAGYFKRDDANEAAFQWGWFRSGDEGFYIADDRGMPVLLHFRTLERTHRSRRRQYFPVGNRRCVEGTHGRAVRHGPPLRKSLLRRGNRRLYRAERPGIAPDRGRHPRPLPRTIAVCETTESAADGYGGALHFHRETQALGIKIPLGGHPGPIS